MTRGARLGSIGAAALLFACGPVPGGKLAGEPATPPADWSSAIEGADGKEICEIESRPADPHSIQLECFLYEGGLYAQSHRWALASWWPGQSWAAIWLEHPDVLVRLDDRLYALRAVRVGEPPRAAILKLRGYDPAPEGIVVFRFEPRAS